MPPAQIPALYRELLRLAARLPKAQAATTQQNIRQRFRDHRHTTNADEVAALVEEAQQRVSYLRMVVPRVGRLTSEGRTVYVFHEGKVVERKAGDGPSERGSRVVRDGSLDPSQLARHRSLLERQHFGGPVWNRQ